MLLYLQFVFAFDVKDLPVCHTARVGCIAKIKFIFKISANLLFYNVGLFERVSKKFWCNQFNFPMRSFTQLILRIPFSWFLFFRWLLEMLLNLILKNYNRASNFFSPAELIKNSRIDFWLELDTKYHSWKIIAWWPKTVQCLKIKAWKPKKPGFD